MGETPVDLRGAEIGQIAIRVSDPARAVPFYRDRLGLRLLFQVPTMAFFQCGGVRLMLGVPETPEFDHPSSILYFRVRDIVAVHATLKERGVEFRGEPHLIHKAADHDLWMAFFHDPEGNPLALMSERPRA